MGEPLNQLSSDVACKASMTQAHCACAGLDDTLSVGEEGSAATLAQEELHAALREVGMQHLTLTAPGPKTSMSLKVLDMCDTRAQGSMLKRSARDAGCEQRAQGPCLGGWECCMVAWRWTCKALQASKAKQRLAIEPGVGRAASSAQALSW